MLDVKTIIAAVDNKLIDDWRRLALRFWSVRTALFWGAFSGLTYAWPAFAEMVSPSLFALLSIVMCAVLAVARLTKQPGVE